MPTYEMLWDCPYCGTKKLLGKTHRFCPKCGAPQDAEKRYFPAEADKVAVEDHQFVGADRVCAACGSAMSARAEHCSQCGDSMSDARDVRSITDSATMPLMFAETHTPQRPRVGRRVIGCAGGVGIALLIGLLLLVFWRRSVEVEVVGHVWERVVTVEELGPQRESAWCNEMPRGARDVRRSREVRSHNRVVTGEDCTTRRVDQGDGTYREEQDCRPRTSEEAVYDDRCSFVVDRWAAAREVRSEGQGPVARWPALRLRSGSCVGCEREGARKETYRVQLRDRAGRSYECALPEDAWAALAPGSSHRLRVAVVTGSPACGDLRP